MQTHKSWSILPPDSSNFVLPPISIHVIKVAGMQIFIREAIHSLNAPFLREASALE